MVPITWSSQLIAQAHIAVAWIHVDAFLDSDVHVVEDMKGFRPWHRWYLWTSTVQWALGVLYMTLMLWAWRHEDGAGVVERN